MGRWDRRRSFPAPCEGRSAPSLPRFCTRAAPGPGPPTAGGRGDGRTAAPSRTCRERISRGIRGRRGVVLRAVKTSPSAVATAVCALPADSVEGFRTHARGSAANLALLPRTHAQLRAEHSGLRSARVRGEYADTSQRKSTSSRAARDGHHRAVFQRPDPVGPVLVRRGAVAQLPGPAPPPGVQRAGGGGGAGVGPAAGDGDDAVGGGVREVRGEGGACGGRISVGVCCAGRGRTCGWELLWGGVGGRERRTREERERTQRG